MTLADIANFIHVNPAMGWLFVLCAIIFIGGVAAGGVALLWAVFKNGKQVSLAAGAFLLIQGFVAHAKFPERGGQYLALGLALAGLALIMGALICINKPDPTPEELEKEMNRETRSALHSLSGKIIVLLGAAACFAVVWVIKNDPQEESSAMMMLIFFLLGCAGILTFLFPSKAASLLEAFNSIMPRRRRW